MFARRSLVPFIGILALSGVLFANIYHIQVVNYDMYQTRSNATNVRRANKFRSAFLSRIGSLVGAVKNFFKFIGNVMPYSL